MIRMAGWYKLDGNDAHMLSEIIATFSSPRSRQKRVDMLLFCYSQIVAKGKPCPYFRLGQRTIANNCGVRDGVARRFLEAMEEQGWFVRIGDRQDGGYQKRTFWWLSEGAESVQECAEGSAQRCAEGGTKAQRECAEGSAQTPCEKSAHQSAKHSESALRSSADAGARAPEQRPEDCTIYDCDLTPDDWLGGADA